MDPFLFKVLPQFARQGDTKDAIKGATLNRESLANITVPLPPLAEQHRIVAKVDELMALCDRVEAAQTERESRRDRLVAASLNRLSEPAADADDAQPFRDHVRGVTIIDGPVFTAFDGAASKKPPSAAMMTRRSTTTQPACRRPDSGVPGSPAWPDACGGHGS